MYNWQKLIYMHHLIQTQIDRLIAVCCPLDIYLKYQTYRNTDTCTNIFLQTRAFLTGGMGESPHQPKICLFSPTKKNPPQKILILFDFQYSQRADFSFEKGLNCQNHSSSASLPPAKFLISPTLTPYWYLENPANW